MTYISAHFDYPSARQILGRAPSSRGRMSFSLCCPACGRQWGTVGRSTTGWYHLTRNCSQCPTSYSINGSFFQNYDWAPLVPSLQENPALLHWEFEAHLQWAERFLQP